MTKINIIDQNTREMVEIDLEAIGGTFSPVASVSAPICGQVIIAVTGTAVPLSATSVLLPNKTVMVTAFGGNSDTGGTVGGSAVTDDVDGTGNGAILEAGKSIVVVAEDLADVYVNGVANDIFSFAAG